MIDGQTLRALLHYESGAGVFIWLYRERALFARSNQWKNWNGRYPGTVAGHIDHKGYRKIGIAGRFYPAHRLAWLYVTGKWPRDQIDHINGDKDDNSFANLRDVPNAINCKNRRLDRRNVTGHIGVTPYFYHGRQQWVARIRVNGNLKHLGYFDTIEEAAAARQLAERDHGFHQNHGKPVGNARLQSRNTLRRHET